MIRLVLSVIIMTQLASASVVEWRSGEMRVNGVNWGVSNRYEYTKEDHGKLFWEYFDDGGRVVLVTPTNAMPTNVWVECIAETNKTITPPTIKDPPVEPLPTEAAYKPTESTTNALLIAFLIFVLTLALSGPSGASMVLLLTATTALAGPPPQRLARTIPPEIVAMIASNAPPGAHIRYRYHRALPYDPTKAYDTGVVVLAPDGSAHISTGPVPAAMAKNLTVEPLLRGVIASAPAALPSATPTNQPPATHFRQVNGAPAVKQPSVPVMSQAEVAQALAQSEIVLELDDARKRREAAVNLILERSGINTNGMSSLQIIKARAAALEALSKNPEWTTNNLPRLMNNKVPIRVPKRRSSLRTDSTKTTNCTLASSAPVGFEPPPPVEREQLERNIARIKAYIAANGPRPKRQRKVYSSAFFPGFVTKEAP